MELFLFIILDKFILANSGYVKPAYVINKDYY